MRPKQRQAKLAAARDHVRAAYAALNDLVWSDDPMPEIEWMLFASKVLPVAERALDLAHIEAGKRQRSKAP